MNLISGSTVFRGNAFHRVSTVTDTVDKLQSVDFDKRPTVDSGGKKSTWRVR